MESAVTLKASGEPTALMRAGGEMRSLRLD
jgi:hypothetical protein